MTINFGGPLGGGRGGMDRWGGVLSGLKEGVAFVLWGLCFGCFWVFFGGS